MLWKLANAGRQADFARKQQFAKVFCENSAEGVKPNERMSSTTKQRLANCTDLSIDR
ncbi:hypothetical protein MUO83_11075 [Candidatus Bathyarchaeota archaeon]|nr:hypothetical protein [Candidatus Bathyarchaeota archaeon]